MLYLACSLQLDERGISVETNINDVIFFLCFNRTAKIYARDFVPGQARLVFLEAEASGKYI